MHITVSPSLFPVHETFLESRHAEFGANWNPEPVHPRSRHRPRSHVRQSRTRPTTRTTTKGQFMERPHSPWRMHWEHEHERLIRSAAFRPQGRGRVILAWNIPGPRRL